MDEKYPCTTDGTKAWFVRYRVGERQLQARLSRPYASSADECHLSLASAIAENARIQSLARDGVDFQMQREAATRADAEAREVLRTSLTPLRALFEAWMADGVSRKDGNAELRRTFEKDVLHVLGDKPVREITDSHMLQVLRQVGRMRGRARTAERMLTELRQMFRWAIKRQPCRALLVEGNPADLVELKQVVPLGYAPGIRERTLRASEIRELRDIYTAMASAYDSANDKRTSVRPVKPETQLGLWICLGTGCRIAELLRSRWEHVDLAKATWFVPRENTKTNVDWQVYLSEFVLRQFKGLHTLTGDSDWSRSRASASRLATVRCGSRVAGHWRIDATMTHSSWPAERMANGRRMTCVEPPS